MRPLRKHTPITQTIDAASEEILPINALRKFATINNPTAVNMWLGLGVAAVIGKGEMLPAGGSYVFDEDNLWQGAVNVIPASGTGHVIGAGDWQ